MSFARVGALSALPFLFACGAASPEETTLHTALGEGGQEIPVRPLAIGATFGTMQPTDPVGRASAHVHRYRIELDPSRRIRMRVISDRIDPTIEVIGPGEQHMRNDDAFPGTLEAMVDFVPSQAGVYEVLVSTAGANQVGPYSLFVQPRDLAGLGAPFVFGRPTSLPLGTYAQPEVPGTWLHFDGQAGAVIRLRVTSQAFDTVAMLLGPGGQTWFNDDANEVVEGERALDSTIVAALPQSGVYQLIVMPYGGQGTGPFNVRGEMRPPVVIGPDGSRPEGLAGPSGGGRILGLYAGITAYPPGQGALFGCADDARMLAQAMRASHLQNETDQLVLPDGLATRDAFLQGIQQIAAQAQPNDVVLIFWSGHGNQQEDDDTGPARELDGSDETIVLYDGAISDDELVRAIANVRAGTIMLALDSCNSGGFADDFVTAPGRMGLFSSDEDVLSDTAEPHGAGGYLSWHLRRGVLGEADARPRDGVLLAGELVDYILDGYVVDHRLMNPEGVLDRVQRLEVRRGSIGWDRMLWTYPRNADFSLPAVPEITLASLPIR
jgi:hypothetical protein